MQASRGGPERHRTTDLTELTEILAVDAEARAVTLTGVWVSAARCIVQYGARARARARRLLGALRLRAVGDPRRGWYAAIAIAALAFTTWSLVHPALG